MKLFYSVSDEDMGTRKQPSKDALDNLLKPSKGLIRSEAARKYHSLSPEAREQVDGWVNQRFRDLTGVSKDFKIDPKNPEHKEFVRIWLSQRDIVMGWGADWEKQAGQKIETSYFSRDLDKRVEKDGLSSTERSANGILRREFTGKEFLEYIDNSFKEPYAEPVQVAYNIIRYAENRHLENACRDLDGMKGILKLYTLLVSEPDNVAYIQQANRIMAAIGGLTDISNGLISKPYLIPAEFTLFDSSHITAKLTEDNKIWLKLNVNAIEGHPEALTLGDEAFTNGIKLDLNEWVRIKLYDEGGVIVYRPAIYLLQLSSKSTKETWSNIINVGALGLPGGVFFRVGGLIPKGGRLLAALAKIEKAVDVVGNGLVLGNIAVRENRGWIIENYPEKGREFIEAFDLASTIAMCYGLTKVMGTAVMGKALEKTVSSWDELKRMGVDSKDLDKINEIDKSINQFKRGLDEVKDIDDTSKLIAESAESSKSMDEAEEITRVIKRGVSRKQQLRDSSTRETASQLDQVKHESQIRDIPRIDTGLESQLSFQSSFTDDQIRNWTADNFWKTPEGLRNMRGRDGFQVVVDNKTNEVIAAYLDYSETSLTTGVRADGFEKLFDAKFDLVVRPDVTGRGIGGEVMRRMLAKAREYGAEHIRVHASNPESLRWFNNMNPIKSTIEGEGGRLVFKVDDLEMRLKPREVRSLNERLDFQIKGQVRSPRLDVELKQLEVDPDLEQWVANRRVSSEEFQNWVRSLPEDAQNEFLLRLKEVPQADSVGNRRFVLRDAAHEIRVNKDLKELGINEIHGDFTGRGSKLERRVADALSSKKLYRESEMVRQGVHEHQLGRSHHNPKTAEDYIHKALDEYDAVTDPLRDRGTGFGYKDPPMTPEQIRNEFINNEKKSFLDRKAMEIVLDWKEKRISPENVLREYRKHFDLETKITEKTTESRGIRSIEPSDGVRYLSDGRKTLRDNDVGKAIQARSENIETVGQDAYDKAIKMGMDDFSLKKYIDEIEEREIITPKRFDKIAEVDAKIVKQIEDTWSLGEVNAKKLIAYGYDPRDVSMHLDNLASKGLSGQEIKTSVEQEIKLMDYYRETYCGGRFDLAKSRITDKIGAGSGVRDSIASEIHEKLWNDWKASDPSGLHYDHLPSGVRNEKMGQLLDEAKESVKALEKSLLGLTVPGIAIPINRLNQNEKKENGSLPKIRDRNRETSDKIKIKEKKNNPSLNNIRRK